MNLNQSISRVQIVVSGNPMYQHKNKTNAIIFFYDSDIADKVLRDRKYPIFKNKQLCLTWYQPLLNREQRKWNLFVKGFPKSWKTERLDDEFSQFGSIASAKVDTKGDGSQGFGWVQFEDQNSALKAIQEMNGRTY